MELQTLTVQIIKVMIHLHQMQESDVVNGIAPELLDRAKSLARRMAVEGLESADLVLLENGNERTGILSTRETGLPIGSFVEEGNTYFICIPM